MKKYEMNLCEGSLFKKIAIFSIPLMFSNILQVLFNMSDIAVVGKFAGSLALGSVGSTSILVTLFTGLLIGFAGGINALTALYIGSRSDRDLTETVHTAAILSFILGMLLMIFGILFTPQVLRLINTKDELITGAVLYLRIYLLGMPALSMYNFGNAVLSAAGDTRRPLYYLTFAGILNVILNLFFVIVCKLDVAGVAIASISSQYISALLILRLLLKTDSSFGITLSALHMTRDKVKRILSISVPSAFQNTIFAIANLFVQTGVNSFDHIMVEGNSAAANSDALVYDVMNAFYMACSSFISQNMGAKKKKRMLQSYFISLAYSFGAGAVLGLSLVVFGRQFLSLFTKDAAVMEAGMARLRVMGFSYMVSAFMDNTIAASRGLGKALVPTIIVILGSCVFRVVWVYTIFAYFHTIDSLYLLYVFSWTITAVAEILYFAKSYRKLAATL